MKSILYYTDNRLREDIAQACIKQINKCRNGYPVVSVSQEPMNFGTNIVMDIGSSQTSMFKQIIAGLEAIETDIVFFCEHDCIYPLGYFDFTPLKRDVYYFNTNVWSVRADTGESLHYAGMKKTSGLVAYRGILLEHYTKKVELLKKEPFSQRKHGYEPGKKKAKGRPNDYDWECFESERPYIDIKHGNNMTKLRWTLNWYRRKDRVTESWIKSNRVPYWGKTKGRFNNFLKEI